MAPRNSTSCSSLMPTGKGGISVPTGTGFLPPRSTPAFARPAQCLCQRASQAEAEPQTSHLCPQHWKQLDAPEEKPRQPGADPEQGGPSVWAGELGRVEGQASRRTPWVLGGLHDWLWCPSSSASFFLQCAGLLMTLKGLPSTYNKDLQVRGWECKEESSGDTPAFFSEH